MFMSVRALRSVGVPELRAPVVDPVCGRRSDELLTFSIADHRWTATWGRWDAIGTPAFWIDQTRRLGYRRPGREDLPPLHDEVVFCLLGGFGVSADAAAEAFELLQPLITSGDAQDAETVAQVLCQPHPASGRRYRFPRQRATRIASAVATLDERPEAFPDDNPLMLRTALRALDGIGPKTASWIVRNVTGGDDVAIVDIWIERAMKTAGIFPREWTAARHYDRLEDAFLEFARLGQTAAAELDWCIWDQARRYGSRYFPVE